MQSKNQQLSPKPTHNDAGSLRGARVWVLIDVMFLTWAFFGLFFLFRGYQIAFQVCAVQAVCYILLQATMRRKKKYLAMMNLYLVLSGIGIFSISISHPNLEYTKFFFIVSIIVASYLSGMKQATIWFGMNVLHFLAYFIVKHGIHAAFTDHLDQLTQCIGVASCLFFCCLQAEASFRSQTQGLLDFSKSLQKRSDELELLATTDSLTGLVNRFQFLNDLNGAVNTATDESKVVLFLIDMDGFKDINDTLGHVKGDEILVRIGERLSHEVGQDACIARLGGDEFCVLVSGLTDTAQAKKSADKIHKVLTRRYHLPNAEISLGTSVGYAMCPDHAHSGADLLACSDIGMYHAKKSNQNVAIYRPEMLDQINSIRTMNDQLAVALEREEFHLVYQPQFDSMAGEIVGVEALMRWTREGETIPPYRFIPLLEKTGRIVEVSKWLIEEACRQQARWDQQGCDLAVSVNISPLQFADDDFVDSVVRPLEKFGVVPERLELEITERILIENVDRANEKLNYLKLLGCKISIDDFGTGYSSLAYLRQFPLDKLKIDRAFIKDFPDSDDGMIARGVVMLADLLGLEVIAEGVETVEQLTFLQRNGCPQIQGYYFSKPVDAEEVFSMVTSQKWV